MALRRCTESLLLHPPLNTFGWSSTDWYHNIWKGMQTFCKNKEGDCCVAPTAPAGTGKVLRELWQPTRKLFISSIDRLRNTPFFILSVDERMLAIR